MSQTLKVKCPICKTQVKRENEYFPFCSPRCQTTDLGNWGSGAYNIPDTSEQHHFDGDEEQYPVIH